jgi:ABC-2 type transport system permease protein
MIKSIKKHLGLYRLFFLTYLKSRMIYKKDFALGMFSQVLNLGISLAFLTLIFTQVETIQGWSFNEMLFLAGFGGLVLNLHHVFFFSLYKLGNDYIITGRLDRFKVRPLNVLYQVFANKISDDNISKVIANLALLAYASSQLGIIYGPLKLVYGSLAVISGVMIIGGIFLVTATTAFWTGRSREAFWLFFRLSDFRKYPLGIYSTPLQIILTTLVPIAFAAFFPATYFLGRDQWSLWQMISLIAGPVFYLIAYQFWKYGLGNYTSTGS